MKPYLLSIGAGLLVGVLYSLMGVRSPAPPAIALLGLLGMLLGERMVPVAQRLLTKAPAVSDLKSPDHGGRVQGPQAVAKPPEDQA